MVSREVLTIDDKFINKQVQLFIHQTMYLKRVETKKLLGCYNKVVNWLFNYFYKIQIQPPGVFYKKLLYLIQNIAKILRAPTLKKICKQLLLKLCS